MKIIRVNYKTDLTRNRYRFLQSITILLILVTGLMLVSAWRYLDTRRHYEDFVFLKQIIENIAISGKPVSDAQDAINDMLFYDSTLTQTPEIICSRPLDSKGHTENLFKYHPYFILYLIAPLVKIFPSELVLSILTSFSFFALAYICYEYLKSKNIPFHISLLFIVLLTVYPPWSHSLQGQYYVERFFIPLAALLILSIERENSSIYLILSIIILSLLVTERTGVVTGVYLVSYAILHQDITKQRRIILIGYGIGAILFSALIIKIYVDNPSYNGNFLPHNFQHLYDRLSNPVFRDKLWGLLLFNAPLLIISIYDWRSMLIAIGMMIPNIIGNVGGAEKTGFLTHYHTLYMPFVVMAAVKGLTKYSRKNKKSNDWKKPVVFLLISITMYMTTCIKDGRYIEFGKINLQTSIIYSAYVGLIESIGTGPAAVWRSNVNKIRKIIPEGTTVTTAFWGIPIVENNRSIYYYPLGIDVAEYALVGHSIIEGKHHYSGGISYLGEKIQKQVDACLTERLEKSGYNVDNPILIDDGHAILNRK